jgi:uncharacterized membrane protein YhaH (DUF805 family)
MLYAIVGPSLPYLPRLVAGALALFVAWRLARRSPGAARLVLCGGLCWIADAILRTALLAHAMATREASGAALSFAVPYILFPAGAGFFMAACLGASSLAQAFKYVRWLLLSAKGRATRTEYWLGFAILLPMLILPVSVVSSLNVASQNPVARLLVMLVFLFCIVANFIVAAKRLHDLGHSGWFQLLGLVPIVGLFFLLYVSFWPGTAAPNAYGPPPRHHRQTDASLRAADGMPSR